MNCRRNRRTEALVYIGIWILIAGLYVLDVMRAHATGDKPLMDMKALALMAKTLVPFFLLFLISNALLIPHLLLRNRFGAYLAGAGFALLLLWAYQYQDFMSHFNEFPIPGGRGGHHVPPPVHRHSLMPLPLFLDFAYGLLVIGGNLAVALLFQRFDDRLERESLQKANAENALSYLKAQINPHFYMNMLNNIHAMIEIDPERAQEMVIDMSRLMRYMLYDSSLPLTALTNEVEFTENYIRLMRIRYPESKVDISARFPQADTMRGIYVPPLLMLVFVENAFKHGISYRTSSYISATLEIDSDRLNFICMNSRHSGEREDGEKTGIGLVNVRQRLDLIFGDSALLDINESDTTYTVLLSIPIQRHEVKDANN